MQLGVRGARAKFTLVRITRPPPPPALSINPNPNPNPNINTTAATTTTTTMPPPSPSLDEMRADVLGTYGGSAEGLTPNFGKALGHF